MLFVALISLIASCAHKKEIKNPVDFSFIAIGDVPYGKWQVEAFEKEFIPQVESEKGDFIIHIGDIKGGGSICSDELFQNVYKGLNSFSAPLFFTPGDNEWTDCHRPRTRKKTNKKEELKYTYPKERLSAIRKTFYADPQISLAGKSGVKIVAKTQPKVFPEFPFMVENQMWSYKNFLFASLHIVGSNNNSPYNGKGGDYGEFKKRDEANTKWLEYAFEQASLKGSKALVIYYHAEVGFDPNPKKRGGFKNFLASLEKLAPNYPGQVLLIHGDSHALTVDRPLLKPGDRFENPIPNVMRLEVPGGYEQMAYMRIDVLNQERNFFRFTPYYFPKKSK